MGECGCVTMDQNYRFPGPGKTFYVLTLSGGCHNCDSPAGICIRHIKPGEFNHEWFSDRDKIDGELTFEMWGDGSGGIAVKTGMVRSEFIKATMQHLVGVDSRELGDESGKIDDAGADAILEEMYDDAEVRPILMEKSP